MNTYNGTEGLKHAGGRYRRKCHIVKDEDLTVKCGIHQARNIASFITILTYKERNETYKQYYIQWNLR